MAVIALFDLVHELERWRALSQTPLLWWRDDDARAPSPQLDRLLTIRSGRPITLAVIPDDDLDGLAARLRGLSSVTIAQHGVDHRNRRKDGEPRSEFAAATSLDEKTAAVAAGRARLASAGLAPAFFVPPWNDYDMSLLSAIKAAGYRTFSSGAFGRNEGGLNHLGAHVDILRWKGRPHFRGRGRIFKALRQELAQRRTARTFDAPIGILTHHLVHDEDAWTFLDWFLDFAQLRFAWRNFAELEGEPVRLG